MANAVKSNAKRSTNARTRGPKAADHKGHQGHALAMLVIAQAEKTGELMLAQQRSRKDVLAELVKFRDNAEHIEFRKELDAKLDQIKAEAGKAQITLNAYSEANPIAASIRAECSLWAKMSTAVEKGFSPDLDKPWPEISKAATAHIDNMRNSTGDSGANGGAKLTNAGPKARKAGRKAQTTVQKAKQFAESVLRDPTTKQPLPKDNRNLAQVVGQLCVDATVDELIEVAATIEKLLETARKIAEQAKAKIDAASASAKDQHDKAMGGGKRKGVAKAEKPATVTDEKIEAAQASTGRQREVRATPSGRPLARSK